MKNALIQFANALRIQCVALLTDSAPPHFPTIVAQTPEGQIMDGPRGLQLITHHGPTPAYKTPNGFLVYNPAPHFLHPTNN